MPPQFSLLRPRTTTPPLPTATTSPSTSSQAPPLFLSRVSFPLRGGAPRLRRRPGVIVNRSIGDGWKLGEIDREAVQERLYSWLGKARELVSEVAAPLVKNAKRKSSVEGQSEVQAMEIDDAMKAFMTSELTIDRRTPNGVLSWAAVISIEQFGRMNGLTGRKMQKIFDTLASEHVQADARNLVEYGCFRYLSRDSSDIHPSLKELAFQRLVFITMLAWEQPYTKDGDSHTSLEISSFQGITVGEKAFVRIASAIAGVADRSTAHHLFKALVGDEDGMSLNLWMSYITELLKVHQSRKSYNAQGDLQISTERILCMGSGRKRPVLKWEKNIAWPGTLTLTDGALYFEMIGLTGPKQSLRLDLAKEGTQVDKTKVGPFGSRLFDSAVAVSSGSDAESWVLEFVDFGGETRRDVWYAFISEIISAYKFIREFGPEDDDLSIRDVYGAHRGNKRAITSAASSIARLQSLQLIRKLSEDPAKLVQFSYLRTVPYGDVVLQTLAVKFWGGPFITRLKQDRYLSYKSRRPLEDSLADSLHVLDIDGGVYLRKWMRSPSWGSSSSVTFWRNASARRGIVLGNNLVVADLDVVEKASLICKEKSKIVERTQASIDAAMIKGIPSNIDLFKELMLPFVVMAKRFEKLRRWEEPRLTICFLAFAYTIIFRNMLKYVVPVTLVILATGMLLLKGLKKQGRLGRYFGKVTIRDQPPSNTIQKIVAVKEAMSDLESSLQNINVSLLKIRTIILSGQPEITNEVSLVLLGASIVLLIVPFRYVLAFGLLDLFTRELEFRRDMVNQFRIFIREKWASIHASSVAVLPYQSDTVKLSRDVTRENDNS